MRLNTEGRPYRSLLSVSAFLASTVVATSVLAQAPEAAEPEGETTEADPEAAEATAGEAPEDSSERLEKLEASLAEQAAKIEAQDKALKELDAKATAADERAAGAEEAATMAMTLGSDETDVEEERLRLYGFADMAYSKKYVNEDSRFNGLIDPYSSFAMGNVNLYVDATPVETFRILSEVRFTLFPQGNADSNFEPTNNSVLDITSATGRNRVIYSGIVMERAWIEWNKYDFFKVRSGLFLTPYGIWNVDHGSPTLISSVLPTFWASEYFPTRQIGVQVLGEQFVGAWELGYRAWLGNGRMTSQVDADQFKHFGGRAYVKRAGELMDVTLGGSGFWGKQASYTKAITNFDPFTVEATKAEQYEEFGVGADLAVDMGDFRLRTEFVLNQQEYEDEYRRASSPVTYQRDMTRWNVYGVASYRLPFAGLEPFVYLEHAKRPTAADNSSSIYSGGLIVHLDVGIQYKFQAFHAAFHDDDVFPTASTADFQGWDMRLVSAF